MSQTPEMMEGAPLIRPSSTGHPLYDTVVEACRSVYDPEIPVNIFDLGLVYTIDIADDNAVTVIMTLTAPGCPVAGEMPGWVADAIEPLEGVKHVDVELTWDPPWGMDMMSDEARAGTRVHVIARDGGHGRDDRRTVSCACAGRLRSADTMDGGDQAWGGIRRAYRAGVRDRGGLSGGQISVAVVLVTFVHLVIDAAKTILNAGPALELSGRSGAAHPVDRRRGRAVSRRVAGGAVGRCRTASDAGGSGDARGPRLRHPGRTFRHRRLHRVAAGARRRRHDRTARGRSSAVWSVRRFSWQCWAGVAALSLVILAAKAGLWWSRDGASAPGRERAVTATLASFAWALCRGLRHAGADCDAVTRQTLSQGARIPTL